jgi:hypothetical protein
LINFNCLGDPRVDGMIILKVTLRTHSDVPQSVGLLWTSDQLVAEIST